MDINSIKSLRSAVPIPLQEAKQLLSANNGDVDKCITIYKDQLAKSIVDQTNCTLKEAKRVLEKEKFDINRALSNVVEDEYDKRYVPIEGVNEKTLLYAKDWLYIIEGKDFGVTLAYKNYDKFIEVFQKLDSISHLTNILVLAKKDYDQIFEGYTDSMPMEEFIRRNSLLDASPNFQKASKCVNLEIEKIKDELRRQWRNVNK